MASCAGTIYPANPSTFQSVRIEFGWQTDGSKDWHHEYNFPTFGLGSTAPT